MFCNKSKRNKLIIIACSCVFLIALLTTALIVIFHVGENNPPNEPLVISNGDSGNEFPADNGNGGDYVEQQQEELEIHLFAKWENLEAVHGMSGSKIFVSLDDDDTISPNGSYISPVYSYDLVKNELIKIGPYFCDRSAFWITDEWFIFWGFEESGNVSSVYLYKYNIITDNLSTIFEAKVGSVYVELRADKWKITFMDNLFYYVTHEDTLNPDDNRENRTWSVHCYDLETEQTVSLYTSSREVTLFIDPLNSNTLYFYTGIWGAEIIKYDLITHEAIEVFRYFNNDDKYRITVNGESKIFDERLSINGVGSFNSDVFINSTNFGFSGTYKLSEDGLIFVHPDFNFFSYANISHYNSPFIYTHGSLYRFPASQSMDTLRMSADGGMTAVPVKNRFFEFNDVYWYIECFYSPDTYIRAYNDNFDEVIVFDNFKGEIIGINDAGILFLHGHLITRETGYVEKNSVDGIFTIDVSFVSSDFLDFVETSSNLGPTLAADLDDSKLTPSPGGLPDVKRVLDGYKLGFLTEFSPNINVDFFGFFSKTFSELEQELGKAEEVNDWDNVYNFPNYGSITFAFARDELFQITMPISRLFTDKSEITGGEIKQLFGDQIEHYAMWDDGLIHTYGNAFYFDFYFPNDIDFRGSSKEVSIRAGDLLE
ncbi:MAG: hypothetical protein FWD44_06435 [Oscillospiraceae bacterium]|nr:hypothetical protein [Oscillospiraceae bacterium]